MQTQSVVTNAAELTAAITMIDLGGTNAAVNTSYTIKWRLPAAFWPCWPTCPPST